MLKQHKESYNNLTKHYVASYFLTKFDLVIFLNVLS